MSSGADDATRFRVSLAKMIRAELTCCGEQVSDLGVVANTLPAESEGRVEIISDTIYAGKMIARWEAELQQRFGGVRDANDANE